jgi:hypothetical protein
MPPVTRAEKKAKTNISYGAYKKIRELIKINPFFRMNCKCSELSFWCPSSGCRLENTNPKAFEQMSTVHVECRDQQSQAWMLLEDFEHDLFLAVLKALPAGTVLDDHLQPSFGFTLLESACIRGYSELLEPLCSDGSSLCGVTTTGKTLLMLATTHARHATFVKLMEIYQYRNIEVDRTLTDPNGFTVLDLYETGGMMTTAFTNTLYQLGFRREIV